MYNIKENYKYTLYMLNSISTKDAIFYILIIRLQNMVGFKEISNMCAKVKQKGWISL
uniref:Triatoma infestans clone ti-70 secreted salivary peptide n=1 Tax=Triatoma infestans TaxID=30076 RepID=A0A161M9V1_TRIIF